MQISFQVIALALLASSQALSTVVTERNEGALVERDPDPKVGDLLKGALGLIAGLVAGAGAAKAGGDAATPAAPAPAAPAAPGSSVVASVSPQPSTAAARRRARRQRAVVKEVKH